jgi:hypothetical protein
MPPTAGGTGPSGTPPDIALPVSVAIVVVAVIAVLVIAMAASWGAARLPPSSGEFGPFFLNDAQPSADAPSFPSCSYVLASWEVLGGGPVNFSIWPPPEISASGCQGPPPSNATTPPGWFSYDPGPVCFESGTGGSCTFTASQSSYWVELWYGPSNASAPVNETVLYGFSYS